MADAAAAKREARRRRILENSESRLQRISGRVQTQKDQEVKTEELKSSVLESNHSPPKLNINGLIGIENTANTQPHASGLINDTPPMEIESTAYNGLAQFLRTNSQELADNNSIGLRKRKEIESKKEDVKEDSHIFERLRDDERPRNDGFANQRQSVQSSEKQMPCRISVLCKLVMGRYVCILLAILANIPFLFDLDYLICKTITLPCILIIVSRLCLLNNLRESSQQGSLVTAALILCNIKPGIIYKFKMVMMLFNNVIKDLALYLFTFVLVHCVCVYCSDTIVQNKLQYN